MHSFGELNGEGPIEEERGFPTEWFEAPPQLTLPGTATADSTGEPGDARKSVRSVGSMSAMVGREHSNPRLLASQVAANAHSQSFHGMPAGARLGHSPLAGPSTPPPTSTAPRWSLLTSKVDVVAPTPGTSVLSANASPKTRALVTTFRRLEDAVIRDAFNSSSVRGIVLRGGVSHHLA